MQKNFISGIHINRALLYSSLSSYFLYSNLSTGKLYSPQIQFRCYFPFVFMLTHANEINASRMRETDDKMRDNIKSHQILPRRTNVFSRADTESTANFVSPRLITSDNFNIFDLHPQPVCSPQMKVTEFPTRTSFCFLFFFFSRIWSLYRFVDVIAIF